MSEYFYARIFYVGRLCFWGSARWADALLEAPAALNEQPP